jgi:phenylacetate-coenzyme A ligase PaaK-like adenylate-forming protein
MAAYRAEQLRSLRAHAYANSPFYRRFHRGYETTPLDQLPVLTKTAVMRNFDELTGDSGVRLAHVLAHLETLQQDELFFGKYRVMRTSGSTGQPGIFLNDPRE